MKKFTSIALSLVLALAVTIMPVSASSADPAQQAQVYVEHSKEPLNFITPRFSLIKTSLSVPKIDYDLREHPVVSMELAELAPGKTVYSTGNFITNTMQLILKIAGDQYAITRVALRDKATKQIIGEKTVVSDIWTTTIVFTNLTSAKKYYFSFDNVGQTTINYKATVQAK